MVSKNGADHSASSVAATLHRIKRLQTDRRYRDAQGVCFIEGVRNFVQVSDGHLDIAVIVYSEKLLTAPLARKLVRRFRRSGVKTVFVSPEQFREISQTHRASGIGAIIRQRWQRLPSITPRMGLWIILDRVRSSGNFGTLIRTLDAGGGAGFILLNQAVDPYAPSTIRASMGSVLHQQFIRTHDQALSQWLQKHQGYVIGASPDGTDNFHTFTYPKNTLIFLGEERKGLSQKQRSMCNALLHIPMVGQVDSLNVAVAGSLLIYEVFRARITVEAASGKTRLQKH